MILDFTEKEWAALNYILSDYRQLLTAGLSIVFPLIDDREKVLTSVDNLLSVLAGKENTPSEQNHRDSSGHAPPTGDASESREHPGEIRGIMPVDSEEGAPTADRSDRPDERVVPNPVGNEAESSPPGAWKEDDSSGSLPRE